MIIFYIYIYFYYKILINIIDNGYVKYFSYFLSLLFLVFDFIFLFCSLIICIWAFRLLDILDSIVLFKKIWVIY